MSDIIIQIKATVVGQSHYGGKLIIGERQEVKLGNIIYVYIDVTFK